jgi:S1-C subfamily serine protease
MRVVNVDPNGNAARASVRPGDVILSIDRQPLRSASDVQGIVLSPGRELDVVAVRDGRIWTTSIGATVETADPVREGLGNLFDRLLQR